jgi:putative component of toxin-antitoxin plasmid stabilization module
MLHNSLRVLHMHAAHCHQIGIGYQTYYEQIHNMVDQLDCGRSEAAQRCLLEAKEAAIRHFDFAKSLRDRIQEKQDKLNRLIAPVESRELSDLEAFVEGVF